jgi:hypothetical protein
MNLNLISHFKLTLLYFIHNKLLTYLTRIGLRFEVPLIVFNSYFYTHI